MPYFLKPFKILQSWERGNFDFRPSEEILFSLTTYFSLKKLLKTDFPFRFCEIGLKNTSFLAEKM